ncbi:cell adhesion molecule 3-like [Ruditapes philippinarum]|uniref:cell adhesion molecule 3-like n=1 Tax=Ruditapes philippinarum TaxID=129788 RepID=UPI00295B9F4C|nr:cell adhesion molecule 3-like [Ruditapes philippinarum]
MRRHSDHANLLTNIIIVTDLVRIWSFNFTKDDNLREIIFEVETDDFPNLDLSYGYKLNITYYPVVTLSDREQIPVCLGKDVDLVCSVDSNPLSNISWHNQTGIIEEKIGANRIELRLKNISTDHFQTYSCKAHNGIGGIVTKNITLIVKDPSEIVISEAINPSAESNIACIVVPIIGCISFVFLFAVIVAVVIRWRRQNAPLDRTNIPEIEAEERKAVLHPSGNVPINNSLSESGNAAEPPVYACVIPKKDRGKFHANNATGNDATNKNNEWEDNLVNADLDLAEYPDLAARRPLVTMRQSMSQ